MYMNNLGTSSSNTSQLEEAETVLRDAVGRMETTWRRCTRTACRPTTTWARYCSRPAITPSRRRTSARCSTAASRCCPNVTPNGWARRSTCAADAPPPRPVRRRPGLLSRGGRGDPAAAAVGRLPVPHPPHDRRRARRRRGDSPRRSRTCSTPPPRSGPRTRTLPSGGGRPSVDRGLHRVGQAGQGRRVGPEVAGRPRLPAGVANSSPPSRASSGHPVGGAARQA